ncbi:early nodulin-like protein 8 [Magnolia sinica]|uniref:early nodulin-like protein 8 n=1 Tax=Magnolia sinica TaxID=86752 RepID=UPI00265930FA|nr:early nodulin-like protein 8 [Magnolia sinica]
MEMAPLTNPKYQLLSAFHFLLLLQTKVLCIQYKVGDLDAWGMPTSSNRQIYTNWSKKHNFQIGDSLMFLYPPSQDSVIQVTEQAFSACNISDPILHMDDGNSVFNITSLGKFYFTSGAPGHCEESQKLEVSVFPTNGSFSPSYAPTMLPANSPSYSNVFGSIPASSAMLHSISSLVTIAIGSAMIILLSCI